MKTIMQVDSNVRIPKQGLGETFIDAIKREFTVNNPDYHKNRMLKIPGWWKTPEEIGMWWETDTHVILPRGCLRQVRDLFESSDRIYGLADRRTTGAIAVDFPEYIGHPLRYYQEEAIAAAQAKQNCILRLPTASGKSVLVLALATRLQLNTLVVLPTVALFKQWCEDARKSLAIGEDGLGIIHQKKRVLRPITAAVQGTLASQGVGQDLKDFFGMVVFDECQLAAASTYVKVIDPFPAKFRIGVSADERRKDRKEYLTKSLFGQVAYQKSRKELEDEGFVNDVDIRVVPTMFDAPWYGLAQSKEDEREIDFNRLLEEITHDDRRNELALKYAYEEIEKGNQVLVLSHRIEHCQFMQREFVKQKIPSGFFLGGAEYSKEFEETRHGINSNELRAGVGTYKAMGVGVNLPDISVGVATTPIAGNPFFLNQVRGRLSRMGKGKKEKSRLYVLWDKAIYPGHLKIMMQGNPTVTVLHNSEWMPAKDYVKKVGVKSR